ncbi:MAG: hypothetical protein R3E02_09955 [Blastomonas sp.]
MSGKRRSALDSSQLIFSFDAPQPARNQADLAGLDLMVSATVARILEDFRGNRPDVAHRMSQLLAEDVSSYMLDAYASKARENHNIPAHRLLALIAVTDRHDALDALVRRIGGSLLVGEEIVTAQIGHIDRQIAELRQKRREIESHAKPIGRSR